MDQRVDTPPLTKFSDARVTADGQRRAHVALTNPRTLWFNTGTRCNITCDNCYIESSPANDRLAYITAGEVEDFLAQIGQRNWPIREIGFTGGEPFLNPEFIAMMRMSLTQGYEVLVLTNAMRPMMRKHMQNGLLSVQKKHGEKLVLRVSLDHWQADLHDKIRGPGTFAATLTGMTWLRDNGFRMTVAGRSLWQETEPEARERYGALFAAHGFDIDPQDPAALVLFPEMDARVDVPEITESCWSILNKSPNDVMCASSRMVAKRKGAERPAVLACTLLPYDARFEMGPTLKDAEAEVALNHPHCAKFCVLGGASCSA